MKKILAWLGKHKIALVLSLIVIGGAGYYWKNKTAAISTESPQKMVAVERGDISIKVSGSGQVEAATRVDLKPVVAGDGIDIVDVRVKNDQVVKEGDIVAVLDMEDAQNQVTDAELELRSAQIKMTQIKDQYPAKTSDDRLNRQVQEVAVTQRTKALSEAKKKLDDYYIKAPFDGIITDLSVESGDSASRDTVIASVITKEMVVGITLNEVDAARVKTGDSVTLTFDALGDVSISGNISKIDTIGEVDQGVVSYGAEIVLNEQNELLKPGMSANAEILVAQKKDVLLVPSALVSQQGGKSFVNLAVSGFSEPNRADVQQALAVQSEKREVSVGITDEVNIEIISGLKEGDVVIGSSSGTNPGGSSSNNPSGERGLFDALGSPGGGQRMTGSRRNNN